MSTVENNQTPEASQVQNILDKWKPLEDSATVDQKNKIGLLYITSVLGLEGDVAEKFASGDQDAWQIVGEKQSKIPTDTEVTSFWNGVGNIFPSLHTKDEINFLINDGGVFGVMEFTYHLDGIHTGTSPVLRKIFRNAVVYK